MKSRKVVEIVSLSVLILFVVGIIGVTSFISKNVFYALKGDDNSFILKDLASTDLPVVNEVAKKIEKPFNDEKTNIQVKFYSKDSSKEDQEKAHHCFKPTAAGRTQALLPPPPGRLYFCQ